MRQCVERFLDALPYPPRCQNQNCPIPLVAKIFDPLDFFPYIFPEIFSRTFLIFLQTFKNCSGLPKFFTDQPKIFPRPTKNVIFLATFHKFLQFCLSNSDVSTTFGHFSQKLPLCWCGSYTHGSQRLMVSTEIIKNWGGEIGGQKIILGGHFPPLAPPWRRHCPQSKNHTVPTCMRKAKTFLDGEYLKEILTTSDQKHFYFRCFCYHSFKKNDPLHKLTVALDIVSEEVKNAECSCVAGTIGFCNHVLALMMKICKFCLYDCKDVSELDMLPTEACTSSQQTWHRRGRGDSVQSQPVMEINVKKPKLDFDTPSSSIGE